MLHATGSPRVHTEVLDSADVHLAGTEIRWAKWPEYDFVPPWRSPGPVSLPLRRSSLESPLAAGPAIDSRGHTRAHEVTAGRGTTRTTTRSTPCQGRRGPIGPGRLSP